MNSEEVVYTVVKDGNRIIAWDMPKWKTLATVLRKWRRGYRQFKEDSVRVNGVTVPPEEFSKPLGDFGSDKLVISVRSIRKKKPMAEGAATDGS